MLLAGHRFQFALERVNEQLQQLKTRAKAAIQPLIADFNEFQGNRMFRGQNTGSHALVCGSVFKRALVADAGDPIQTFQLHSEIAQTNLAELAGPDASFSTASSQDEDRPRRQLLIELRP